jgi:hypothetical protein
MPKASLATKDAYELKGGFQEGWGEIIDAKSRVVQFNPSKKTGQQFPAFLALVVTIQRTDEHGKATADEPVENELKLHGDLSQMRPGNVKGRDDNDPTDVDDNATLGTEGNCIFVAEDGIKLNKGVKGLRFLRSLEEHGFKPDILGAGYFPDLIGTRAHFKTIVGEKFRSDAENDPTYLTVDKISQYGYEKKAKAKPAAASATATPKVNGAVAADNGDDSKAREIVAAVASANSGQTMPVQKFNVIAFQTMAKDKSIEPSARKKIQEQLKNTEWLAEVGVDVGLMVDGGDVTFA